MFFFIALSTLLSTALPIAFALGILNRLLMTASHVFPNYLIHYHFLPEKVNKWPFVLNVTGDYL